jgi:hypothetical protein
MKTIKMLALAGAAMMAISAPALAATITYDLSGSFTGVNGGEFNNVDAVFTGIGETDDAVAFDASTTIVPLSSFTAFAGGLTYTFTSPISFFVNRDEDFAGFVSGDVSSGFVRFTSTSGAGLTGYDGISNLAPTAATFFTNGSTGTFTTDRGDVLITRATNLVVSATVAAVPEPATWAMMFLGFGMMGASMRYRRRETKVAYA